MVILTVGTVRARAGDDPVETVPPVQRVNQTRVPRRMVEFAARAKLAPPGLE
eukprot:ctg_4186.g577